MPVSKSKSKRQWKNLTSDLSICQVAKTPNECFILTVDWQSEQSLRRCVFEFGFLDSNSDSDSDWHCQVVPFWVMHLSQLGKHYCPHTHAQTHTHTLSLLRQASKEPEPIALKSEVGIWSSAVSWLVSIAEQRLIIGDYTARIERLTMNRNFIGFGKCFIIWNSLSSFVLI